ncbi:unnamed protein product [Caretta caretta]
MFCKALGDEKRKYSAIKYTPERTRDLTIHRLLGNWVNSGAHQFGANWKLTMPLSIKPPRDMDWIYLLVLKRQHLSIIVPWHKKPLEAFYFKMTFKV